MHQNTLTHCFHVSPQICGALAHCCRWTHAIVSGYHIALFPSNVQKAGISWLQMMPADSLHFSCQTDWKDIFSKTTSKINRKISEAPLKGNYKTYRKNFSTSLISVIVFWHYIAWLQIQHSCKLTSLVTEILLTQHSGFLFCFLCKHILSIYPTELVMTCWPCCSQCEHKITDSLKHWRTFYCWFLAPANVFMLVCVFVPAVTTEISHWSKWMFTFSIFCLILGASKIGWMKDYLILC